MAAYKKNITSSNSSLIQDKKTEKKVDSVLSTPNSTQDEEEERDAFLLTEEIFNNIIQLFN